MGFKFPLPTSEDWRFTDLTILNSLTFDYAAEFMPDTLFVQQIQEHFLANTLRIVMVNGFYREDLSNLSTAENKLGLLNFQAHSESTVDANDNLEDNLNQLQIVIKDNLEAPLHFLNIGISANQNTITNLQVDFNLESNTHLQLIEEHISYGEGHSLAKRKTSVNIQADATLEHTFIQAMAKTSFNFGIVTANLAKNSLYNTNIVINGARLSRYDLNINLNENYAAANIYGLCLLKERQIAGLKSVVKHNASDTQSNHLHKSIVDGGAHSTFNGTICVAPNALRTQSQQQNRSLMLAQKSRITTEPRLEINNDDVVCTHGATISQMDEDIIFFLKARGISAIEAKKLCIDAFASEIINKIEHKDIRQRLV